MGWPAGEVEAFVRRRVLWVVLACLLAPVALYALLPIAAATGLTYFLHQQEYHDVTVQLDIQDGTRYVPFLSFQKDLDGESLSVTVQDSRLQYDIGHCSLAVSIALSSPTHLSPAQTRWERWPGMWAIPDGDSRARPTGQCTCWTAPATSA